MAASGAFRVGPRRVPTAGTPCKRWPERVYDTHEAAVAFVRARLVALTSN